MVTYLACFIVCDFSYEEKLTKMHSTKFRVYATPTQKDRVRYSLDIGANITDFFVDYFDVRSTYFPYLMMLHHLLFSAVRVPLAQAGHDRHPRLRVRRDGTLGTHYVSR